jgi:hypothetical protein
MLAKRELELTPTKKLKHRGHRGSTEADHSPADHHEKRVEKRA